jgi:SPP1 gp7 family putative phage head morphogenesis protein
VINLASHASLRSPRAGGGVLKEAVPRFDLHRLLRQLLSRGEPQIIGWLRSVWRSQGRELTTTMVQRIIAGLLPQAELLAAFRADYERVVNERLYRLVRTIATEFGERWARSEAFPFDPRSERLERAILGRLEKLPVQLATDQVAALNELVSFYTTTAPAPAGVMADRIRRFIGLTRRELRAVENLEASLIEAGASPGTIARQVAQYADLQQQARALRIARTELSYATTAGQLEAVQQAVDAGLLKRPLTVWSAADDEVTCPICGDLDGTAVSAGQMFPGGYDGPPAHPSCRCVLIVEEGWTD